MKARDHIYRNTSCKCTEDASKPSLDSAERRGFQVSNDATCGQKDEVQTEAGQEYNTRRPSRHATKVFEGG